MFIRNTNITIWNLLFNKVKKIVTFIKIILLSSLILLRMTFLMKYILIDALNKTKIVQMKLSLNFS